MTHFPFAFEGAIAYLPFDRYAYTVLYLPREMETALSFPRTKRLRVVGEVADLPVAGAWQRSSGRWYFILSKRFHKAAEAKVGDIVEMRFSVDDQNAVDTPTVLQDALKRNKKLAVAWAGLTPGAQRAFAHRIASAKTPATEMRRVAEVADMILSGRRPGPPRKRA